MLSKGCRRSPVFSTTCLSWVNWKNFIFRLLPPHPTRFHARTWPAQTRRFTLFLKVSCRLQGTKLEIVDSLRMTAYKFPLRKRIKWGNSAAGTIRLPPVGVYRCNTIKREENILFLFLNMVGTLFFILFYYFLKHARKAQPARFWSNIYKEKRERKWITKRGPHPVQQSYADQNFQAKPSTAHGV